ncbi:2OG-Fe(II) oxygenase family protein [Longispora urticae]
MRIAMIDCAGAHAPEEFTRSLHETGFAVLTRHPVPPGHVSAMAVEWLRFFGGGAKFGYRNTVGQDGYFPPDPAPEGEPSRDHKEFFHVRPGGVYPGEVSDQALRHFDAALALARTLLTWLQSHTPRDLSSHCGTPVARMLDGSSGSVLRIQHYLPLDAGLRAGPLRAVAHMDLNLITILPTPSEPGLEVQDVHGHWHEIPRSEGSLVINVGEMLELLSGGYFPATPHRVRHPRENEASGSRLSFPLFLHPAAEVVLTEGTTAETFLRRRIAELRGLGWRPAPGGDGRTTSGRAPATS